jgi:tetratricopeptide (TPR) repeat protein
VTSRPTAPAPLPNDLLEAGRALANGEPLKALGLVGRAESPLGLTLRGIAYAQIGDLELATRALDRAVALAEDPLTRARARAALVEIAMNTDDPGPAVRAARASAEELTQLGDTRNAAMQYLVLARGEVLLGHLAEARQLVDRILGTDLAPDVRAIAWLARAEIAVRAVAPTDARGAIAEATRALEGAPNQVLARALVAVDEELARPVARILRRGSMHEANLFAIEGVSRGDVLLVDACRQLVLGGRVTIPLARRPVLFALLLVLARAWPNSVTRDALARGAFGVQRLNESHRARLRVEIGRLRKVMDDLAAEPIASQDGYVLSSSREVVVLLPPSDDDVARVALLLGDGAAWSAQGLAEHAGISKRTAQRALGALVANGGAVRTGKGKQLRYTRPGSPIASRMLLLGLVPKP